MLFSEIDHPFNLNRVFSFYISFNPLPLFRLHVHHQRAENRFLGVIVKQLRCYSLCILVLSEVDEVGYVTETVRITIANDFVQEVLQIFKKPLRKREAYAEKAVWNRFKVKDVTVDIESDAVVLDQWLNLWRYPVPWI